MEGMKCFQFGCRGAVACKCCVEYDCLYGTINVTDMRITRKPVENYDRVKRE